MVIICQTIDCIKCNVFITKHEIKPALLTVFTIWFDSRLLLPIDAWQLSMNSYGSLKFLFKKCKKNRWTVPLNTWSLLQHCNICPSCSCLLSSSKCPVYYLSLLTLIRTTHSSGLKQALLQGVWMRMHRCVYVFETGCASWRAFGDPSSVSADPLLWMLVCPCYRPIGILLSALV